MLPDKRKGGEAKVTAENIEHSYFGYRSQIFNSNSPNLDIRDIF